MTQKETKRYEILQKAIENKITTQEASHLLDLTDRHIRRLKKEVGEYGIKALVHKSRGNPSNRKMSENDRNKIVSILKEKYSDFKPTFATEKLEECHNIKRDPKTIRMIMAKEGLWRPKKKKKKEYHAWRKRKSHPGEMLQYDGSYDYWFEDRGKKACLLAAIDDADSTVTARFDEHEGVHPTFGFWKEYLETKGKPHSIYADKFSTYSVNHAIAKENPDTLTQFQRAMRQLGIEVIPAHSSQAKGRVERLFSTLQDRLIKELRLKGISTIEEANVFLKEEFLKKFNKKFSVKPEKEEAIHIPLTKKEKTTLPSIFTRQHQRTVRNDFTISYKNHWYQIERHQPTTVYKKDQITIEEYRDGNIKIKAKEKYLNFTKLPKKPEKRYKTEKEPWVLTSRIPHKPAANHPWRKFHYASVRS